MIGRSFNELFEEKPQYNIWGDTLTLLKKGDFFGINLETTITDRTKKFPDKVFNFRLGSRYKQILKLGHVTYANLANNHILDYGEMGLVDTINNLDSLNIIHTGAGKNLVEAMNPAFYDINGIKIGIISASDHPENFQADHTGGIYFIDLKSDLTDHIARITSIRSKVDILIFSMHHGANYVDRIPNNTIRFFHELIDNGVDIIHGHSAHHVLPIELYKNGYIFYGMGDFVDDYAVDEKYRNDLSFLAEIRIKNRKINQIKVHPTKILMLQVNLLDMADDDYRFVIDHTIMKQLGGKDYYHAYQKYKHKYNNLKRIIYCA